MAKRIRFKILSAERGWWKPLADYLSVVSENPPVFSLQDAKILIGQDYVEISAEEERKIFAVLFAMLEIAPIQIELKPYYGNIAKALFWGVSHEEYSRQKARAERLERVLSMRSEEKRLGLKKREKKTSVLKPKPTWQRYLEFLRGFLR